ncbi:MAG: phosphoglycerate dehydrogenase [Pyrinomonadaceae bacterium]|nr:phosphoglycerate dehydrogenase [Phycisphaerales bacterium]
MKVLIADKFEQIGHDGLASLGCEVLNQPEVAADALAEALKNAGPTVLIVRSKKVNKAAIEAGAAAGLKAIIRAGAGFDNIDCAAAAARGVAVCNCPGMNAVAVAELTMGLLICLDRRIPDQTAELRGGHWKKKDFSVAKGLKGQTLGVIGMGAIGREVVRRAQAFGMKVIAHSLNMSRDRAHDLHIEDGGSTRAELLAMLPRCDAVTIHVAANPESDRMCNTEFFAAMKPGAYFINTSRGSVVDEPALLDAMKSKKIRVGLDVFENEPAEGACDWTTQVASLPGTVVTHHVGASTDQAQTAVADEVVRIVRVFKGAGRWENKVN